MAAPVPVTVGVSLNVSAVVPRFSTVTASVLVVATVPKAGVAGVELTSVPVPLSASYCGLPPPLSKMLRVAVTGPMASALLNSTLYVQLAF